jgi:homoserine dehydrogenase
MSTDANAAIDDPATGVVIELIGGTGVAGTFVERALRLGKPVVTANKALLAARGRELFALARQKQTAIAFEASAGGGIPIIDALMRGLVANRVDALLGIVNGTCNFILSKMTQNGWTYEQALREAQQQGFAEANPAMDVEGRDAAQKLVILGSIAFNVRLSEKDIFCQGIDGLDAQDIRFAQELGYVIKLLAIGERVEGRIALRVHPTLVHHDDLLAEVSGSFNAISVYSHALGHALWYGRGAGRMPTASAVVADLVGIGLGTVQQAFGQLNVLWDTTEPPDILPFDQLRSRYYLRLQARDQPGVLAQVTTILGDQGISLSAIRQHETHEPDNVPVVITTHQAREGAMQEALRRIAALGTINSSPVCLRIVDQPREFAAG